MIIVEDMIRITLKILKEEYPSNIFEFRLEQSYDTRNRYGIYVFNEFKNIVWFPIHLSWNEDQFIDCMRDWARTYIIRYLVII